MSEAVRELVWQVVEGEAVIVDVSSGDYFSLNPTATNVWIALHDGATVPAIVDDAAARYGVDRSTVESDVHDLVGELEAAGLWTP